VIDLSANEAETLAAKVARGAGFSWGLSDDIGRAARAIAPEGEDWSQALLALARAGEAFEAPNLDRVARWRRGERDVAGARLLCPVRTAALLLDDPPDFREGSLEITHVGLPIWLDALLRRSEMWIAPLSRPLVPCDDVTIRLGARPARSAVTRRPVIEEQTLATLNAYAARTYVPESERSRRRGAGGGKIDDD